MMSSMTSTSPETPAETPAPGTGRDFGSIGGIGLGTMGAGIARAVRGTRLTAGGGGVAGCSARNAFSVVGVEQNEEALARGRQHLEHSTARAVKRGKLSEA